MQANATGSTFSIHVATGRVYVAPRGLGNTDGLVRSVPTEGGEIKQHAANQVRPQGIVADENNVYWLSAGNGSDGTLQKASLDSGSVTQVIGSLQTPLDLAIDGATIRFTTAGSGTASGGLFRLVK